MQQVNMRDVSAVTKALIDTQAYQAVKFVSENFVVRATKPRYRHRRKQWDARDRHVSLVVSFGAPNYRERAHLKRFGSLPRRVVVRDFPRPR